MSMASRPSGWRQCRLADGSVRFLKDSIDCWSSDPTKERGHRRSVQFRMALGSIFINPGTRVGVLQKLCTRNLGDSVGADSY